MPSKALREALRSFTLDCSHRGAIAGEEAHMGLQSKIETARVSSALENGRGDVCFSRHWQELSTKLGVLRDLRRGVTAYVIDPEGEYADIARQPEGRGALPRSALPGYEILRHRVGRLGGDAPAHRQPETSRRGDGGRAAERRASRIPRPRPGGLLRPAPRSAPASTVPTGTYKRRLRVSRLLGPFATGSLRRDRVRPATGPTNGLI